ncbi:exo-poly-alpha-galacturonosidase [Arthrobacter silviterrae]|uniref:Fibronectin type-III domain-containing protein n=1 Tax=Arthrobacter silviterrae TaxID=2026658 RepID=A0ABX0DI09_9MICC|nr:glycosyl hydrolase family 28 protein [Arthrobacter silviterrae]MDQ0277869.1 exo-poly-alpha-galacturonosidase [Arthrobacter silviterrae]NGN85075.1 hypothetical protein [Arthrobacter silviterrae]
MRLRTIAGFSAAVAVLAATLATPPALAASHNEAPTVMHGSVAARPAAPESLRIPALAFDESTVSLVWNKPEAYQDIVDYHVYQDGRLIGSASKTTGSASLPYIDAFYADRSNAAQVKVVMNNFTVTGLSPDTKYRFTVRAVDSRGVESVDSKAAAQLTAKLPVVFNVSDYGAVGDGKTLNTEAIQRTIDAATPGATVLIPEGTFKSGALWLKSNMTFKVAANGTLLGSENAADYPWNYRLYDYSTDERFYSLINAQTFDGTALENIRIVGPGTIDGNGWKQAGLDAEGFPVSTKSSSTTVNENGILAAAQVKLAAELGSPAPYPTRSNLITLRGVTNAYYGGFTALNPSNHTLVNLDSNNVTVNDVKLLTFDDNNADGIEFAHGDGLTVYNTLFDTGDDCMNFAAGLGQQSVNEKSTKNAWIFNNYFREGHGAVVAGSHTGAVIENVTAEDNVLNKTEVGLRMKTNPTNGGGAQNFLFRDNAMKNIAKEAFIFTSEYSDANAAISVEPATQMAYFRNIRVENVTVDGVKKESIKVVGTAAQSHQGIHFSNVRFIKGTKTNISFLEDSSFTNVVFDNVAEPWVVTSSKGLSFPGATTATAVSDDAGQAPTWPAHAGLQAVPGQSGVELAWEAATDNRAVSAYRVFANGRLALTVPATATSAALTGLAPKLGYDLEVRAYDATGNASTPLTAKVKTTGAKDKDAPVVPAGADAITVRNVSGATGSTWAAVQWQPATDNYGVDSYLITVNGKKALTVPADQTSATIGGLAPDAVSVIGITAIDATGNSTNYPGTLTVATPANPQHPTDPRLK